MDVIVAIQARTNSSRLPAKALLPIGGMPLAVLSAKRAQRNGKYNVLVLTSDEVSDDYLCAVLRKWSVDYFRGSLENVLGRYVAALKQYDDESIVVRLTADNPLPDSDFINEVIEEFSKNNTEYMQANGVECGLPYGLSVEVMKLGVLRIADENVKSSYDREHVTPYIRRTFGAELFKKYVFSPFAVSRCTVDNLDDYLVVSKSFESAPDPIEISYKELLKTHFIQYYDESIKTKLTLGTAQLGFDYGITNKTGQVVRGEAYKILTKSARSGVQFIDTARAYADSEYVIGSWLKDGWRDRVKIITKLDPAVGKASFTSREVEFEVTQSILESMLALRVTKLDVVMLHRADVLKECNNQILRALKKNMDMGRVHEIGVSIQTVDELGLALNTDLISHIQMPFNVLDGRWRECVDDIYRAKKQRNITIHVRSTYLQGLLLSSNEELWKKSNFKDPMLIIGKLESLYKDLTLNSVKELCFSYVNSLDWVDSIVVGVNSAAELIDNIKMSSLPKLDKKKIELIEQFQSNYSCENQLNPGKWNN